MAAPKSQENQDKEVAIFITEYNLQTIASQLYDENVNINALCGESNDEIVKFAKQLTSNADEQKSLINAITDRKSKMKSKSNHKKDASLLMEVEQIYVQSLTGKTLSLDITTKTTIKELKQQIEDKEGIKKKQQNLVFAGKSLENDNATIDQYNIEAGAQLHIVVTPSKPDCCFM
eukprot:454101_1